MKILALDLSTKSSGWAFGEDTILKLHGCITASSKTVEQRILKMRNQFINLMIRYCPNKIIIQEVRPQVNSHTNKVLMWLQGVISVAAYETNHKIQIQFIGASEWRAALKVKQGRGIKRDEVKSSDIQYVKNKYNIIVNDDEADAIGIFDSYWIRNDNNEINWGD